MRETVTLVLERLSGTLKSSMTRCGHEAAQKLRFELNERDLSMVSEAGEVIIAEGQYSVSVGGGQPNTGAPGIAGKFQVKGTKKLPE